MQLGRPLIELFEITSTNTYAKKFVRDKAAHGTCVTAHHQTGGRGRLSRRWLSEPGKNVLVSFVLHPKREFGQWGGIPLLAGISVVEVIRDLSAVVALLKWPNDVLVDGKKIAGILIETGTDGINAWAILGIGLNVNQRVFSGEYRTLPTSLTLASGREFELAEVRETLCSHLSHWYELWETEGNQPIINAWCERTNMIGKTIRAEFEGNEIVGTAESLSSDGALILRTGDEQRTIIHAGEVMILNCEED